MDEIIRAVSADGFVKMQVITARSTVQRAQDIHHLTPTTSAALGRTLCAASMLGDLMKEDDASLTIRVQGRRTDRLCPVKYRKPIDGKQ